MQSILTLALVYLVVGKLSLQLAVVNAYATAVWPPTGIALAASSLGGYRLWPGVFAGAFLVNVTTGAAFTLHGVLAAVGIATGNTLEALVGAFLVYRFAKGARAFDEATTTFKFALLAGLASTVVGATIGVLSLELSGLATPAQFSDTWYNWWIGDTHREFDFRSNYPDLGRRPACEVGARTDRGDCARPCAPLRCSLGRICQPFSCFSVLLAPRRGCVSIVLRMAFRFGRREVSVAILRYP